MAETKLRVQWLVNAIGFGKGRISLGFCEKQPERIAFVAPNQGMAVLIPMIARDLYITARGCEETKRCLIQDCPFNRTTFTSYINSAKWKKNGIPRKKNFKILLNRLSEWGEMLRDQIAQLDWKSDLTHLYLEPVIVLRSKKT